MFRSKWSLLAIVIAVIPSGVARAESAMGAHFTYQGKLTFSSSPINDTCDIEFGLWDNLLGPNQVGVIHTATNVAVVDGLFTTDVAFAVGSFNGNARYLELAVRCPAGGGAYTPLTPRQELTAAPHALALPGMRTEWVLSSPPSPPNVIGGAFDNSVLSGVEGGTIGGGGGPVPATANRVTDDFATVSGGVNNLAGNNDGVVDNNTGATVGGGIDNAATGHATTIAGGQENIADGLNSSVGGGWNNNASGFYCTVPGGRHNTATQHACAAMGYRAKSVHEGSYVWADHHEVDFITTGPYQYLIRAEGGVGINTNSPGAALHVGGVGGVDGIMFPDGTLQTTAAAGGSSNTLDGAYDEGGAGSGRTITADSGAVNIAGANGLTVNGNVGIGSTSTSQASLFIENTGVGLSFRANDTFNDTTPFVIDNSGRVGVQTASPSSPLTVAGIIESTSGGIKYPDGSIQTSAPGAPSAYTGGVRHFEWKDSINSTGDIYNNTYVIIKKISSSTTFRLECGHSGCTYVYYKSGVRSSGTLANGGTVDINISPNGTDVRFLFAKTSGGMDMLSCDVFATNGQWVHFICHDTK